jgi:chemotaxis protein methyltransferase CheR
MDAVNTWEWFIDRFKTLSKIDLTLYKRPQMERRINSFMRTNGYPDYKVFLDTLGRDKELYHRFIEHLTINVSEFFRNTNQWDELEKKIIPELYQKKRVLKIWSAGCSTGEEPYSLAILFKEKFGGKIEPILASDLDQEVIAKAQTGLYAEKSLADAPKAYVSKYFHHEGETYRISDEIKRLVKFKRHDLLQEAFPKDYDLILCRNVVIYFTEESKQILYRNFAQTLNEGGMLFIGNTEQIMRPQELGLDPYLTFFYRKASAQAPPKTTGFFKKQIPG